MPPYKETEYRDGDARVGDETVSEDGFTGETGYYFVDDGHARQNHDVHGRVGVEPEQVLKQDGVAAERRVEDAGVEHAFQAQQDHGDRDDGCTQNLNQAGGVLPPNE